MYVATATMRNPARASRMLLPPVTARRSRKRGLGYVGDSCTIDPTTGANVCSAGTSPAAAAQAIAQNQTPVAQVCAQTQLPAGPHNPVLMGPPDPGTGRATSVSGSGGSIVWNPSSGNRRTFAFMYHSVDSAGNVFDVYQNVGGGSCSGGACNYMVVNPSGQAQLANSPPPQQETYQNCNYVNANNTPVAPTTVTPLTPATMSIASPSGGSVPVTYAYDTGYPIDNGTWPSYGYGAGYQAAATPAATAAPTSTSFLSTLPSWAKYAGAGVLGLVAMQYLKGKR